jgi:hypothetical protein
MAGPGQAGVPPGQTTPQAPQLLGSLLVSVQTPLQLISGGGQTGGGGAIQGSVASWQTLLQQSRPLAQSLSLLQVLPEVSLQQLFSQI